MPDALEFPLTRRTVAGLLLVSAPFFLVGSSHAQTSLLQDSPAKAESKPVQAPPPVANGTGNTSEVTSRDTAATFKVRVNLVLVRVVVRDALGKVVTGLKKEDFQLSDNRKAQTISTFSVETPASHVAPVTTPSVSPAASAAWPLPLWERPSPSGSGPPII